MGDGPEIRNFIRGIHLLTTRVFLWPRGARLPVMIRLNYMHEFEGKVGVSIGTAGGVSGFIEGFGNIGDNYKGGGGRGGLRIKF